MTKQSLCPTLMAIFVVILPPSAKELDKVYMCHSHLVYIMKMFAKHTLNSCLALFTLRFASLNPRECLSSSLNDLFSQSKSGTNLLHQFLFAFLDFQYFRLDGVLSDQLIDVHRFLLSNPVHPINGLRFNAFLPPSVQWSTQRAKSLRL